MQSNPVYVYILHTLDQIESSSFIYPFLLSFLQDQNEIFILVLSLFDLIPFLFHFPIKGGNFLTLSFKPLVSSTIFFLILF